uniref:Uncharacterized protein n=1 Tax=Oryza punctata TaxID=4537 RepID=A0A0E0MI13_ORYPU
MAAVAATAPPHEIVVPLLFADDDAAAIGASLISAANILQRLGKEILDATELGDQGITQSPTVFEEKRSERTSSMSIRNN